MNPVPRNLRFASGPKTIASVYPGELRLVRRHAGYTEYILPAYKEGGDPSTLVVEDTVDLGIDRANEPETMRAMPVPADIVAEDLVRNWSTSSVGASMDAGPGVWICNGDKPTKEETQAAKDRQQKYLNALIHQADLLFATGKGAGQITGAHRQAATWMRLNREWAKDLTASPSEKSCPACAESIKGAALYCKVCHTDLVEFYNSKGIEPTQDPVALEALKLKRLQLRSQASSQGKQAAQQVGA